MDTIRNPRFLHKLFSISWLALKDTLSDQTGTEIFTVYSMQNLTSTNTGRPFWSGKWLKCSQHQNGVYPCIFHFCGKFLINKRDHLYFLAAGTKHCWRLGAKRPLRISLSEVQWDGDKACFMMLVSEVGGFKSLYGFKRGM